MEKGIRTWTTLIDAVTILPLSFFGAWLLLSVFPYALRFAVYWNAHSIARFVFLVWLIRPWAKRQLCCWPHSPAAQQRQNRSNQKLPQAKSLTAKTIRNLHQVIDSAMRLAREQKLIAVDPTDGCALPGWITER